MRHDEESDENFRAGNSPDGWADSTGAYFLNANWGGSNLRDAGLSAVIGYRFNERWEGYLYGQKSLMRPKVPWLFCDPQELGDRIGAAIRYNFSPAFSVQLSVEERR